MTYKPKWPERIKCKDHTSYKQFCWRCEKNAAIDQANACRDSITEEDIRDIKIPVSIEKCNYCGSLFVLQDDFGTCRKGCPGYCSTVVDSYEIKMSERLAAAIVKHIKEKLSNKGELSGKI